MPKSNNHGIYNGSCLIPLTHVYREANLVADGLAKYSLSFDTSINFFLFSLNLISIVLLTDATCIVFSRGF